LKAWSADEFPVNAPLLPEILARREASPQADLPLTAEGVLRYVWESKFGDMLIEVKDEPHRVSRRPVSLSQTVVV
jgi:hypothetical protein